MSKDTSIENENIQNIFCAIKPTRTVETEKNYLKRAKNQAKKFILTTNTRLDNNESALKYVDWLISKRKDYSKSSWRQIKASNILFLNKLNYKVASKALSEIDSSESFVLRTKKDKILNGKTSTNKSKKISDNDLQKIINELDSTINSKWSLYTKFFLLSTLIVGLRPSEWKKAKMVNEVIDGTGYSILMVKNGKNSNGRSHGESRRIILNNLNKDKLLELDTHFKLMKKYNLENSHPNFDKYYDGIRQKLSSVTKKLWPKRKIKPTMYSARHQFAANLKKSGYTKVEIAVLMGHATDRTATEHYGRKKSGEKSGNLVTAHPEEIGRIKLVSKTFNKINKIKGPS